MCPGSVTISHNYSRHSRAASSTGKLTHTKPTARHCGVCNETKLGEHCGIGSFYGNNENPRENTTLRTERAREEGASAAGTSLWMATKETPARTQCAVCHLEHAEFVCENLCFVYFWTARADKVGGIVGGSNNTGRCSLEPLHHKLSKKSQMPIYMH